MVLRTAVPLLLLFVCASASPQAAIQTPAQAPTPSGPRVFHDASLGVTYFYPSRFTPAQPAAAPRAAHQCAQSIFSGTSTTPVGSTVFVLSTIDNTCPEVLQWAARQLGDFTREQVLRQLKQYGDPTVMRDPTRYSIDGHPAAITIASVKQAARTGINDIAVNKITYAAKSCVLGKVPSSRNKSALPEGAAQRILCFDFTTQEHDLLPLMLAFTMQFDGRSLQPVVPGSILR